jgi:hypothetical protein
MFTRGFCCLGPLETPPVYFQYMSESDVVQQHGGVLPCTVKNPITAKIRVGIDGRNVSEMLFIS